MPAAVHHTLGRTLFDWIVRFCVFYFFVKLNHTPTKELLYYV